MARNNIFTNGLLLVSGILLSALAESSAAELRASDGVGGRSFGLEVSQSGNLTLVGRGHNDFVITPDAGSAYVFRNLATASGTLQQNLELFASDGSDNAYFGFKVALSGNIGLISGADAIGNNLQVYLFRGLDSGSGTRTSQNAILRASDGVVGSAVSLSGSTGIASNNSANSAQGKAYLYRNLDGITGTVTQNAIFVASDGAADDFFGADVSVSGGIGLIGTSQVGKAGAAYVFRNLTVSGGPFSESQKLAASDGATDDRFGSSVSLSGATALVGASGDDIGAKTDQGSAYVFRGVDTGFGTATETTKLTAGDGNAGDRFGFAVSLSGGIGLIGAPWDNDAIGAAYLFRNLDAGTPTQFAKIKPGSHLSPGDNFGGSVSLEGDQFIIGATSADGIAADTGTAYSGSVASISTLDAGNTTRRISEIDFTTSFEWIIGENTDTNTVVLENSSGGTILGETHVGKNAGADNNVLVIAGPLFALADMHVGSIDGNSGNVLRFDSTGTAFSQPINYRLADGNFLALQGDFTPFSALETKLNSATLQVRSDGAWVDVSRKNANALINLQFNSATGYTSVTPIGVAPPTPPTPDATRPTLKVKGRRSVDSKRRRIVFRGTADDTAGIALVEFKVSGQRGLQKARGTNKWKAIVFPDRTKRRTVVKVRAIDPSGNRSRLLKLKVFRR